EKQNAQSAPGAILRHIARAGALRKPQADAIETYLWLKFRGNNRRLADLVMDGELRDREWAREHSCDGAPYKALQEFLIIFACKNGLANLESSVRRDLSMKHFEWERDLRKLLHDFAYPNTLYSLPMGAGKTYLMAAFIAIDLHFSRLLPSDERFAHNFVVFAPHAAKTAILPSLKTIRAFDPNWVLPPAGAEEVRREMRVEILDTPKSVKKSTRVNNPNLEKVNRLSQTRKRGLVFITNAEKVVLEKYKEHDELQASLGMKARDDLEKINELRECMAKIPNLAVFLDEVHHAYQGNAGAPEKKLRDAVKVLSRQRNLRGVIGFSGTPFVATKADVGGNVLRLKQLQDVVYDYPLARGIGAFLKTPKVVRHRGVREAAFVHAALDDFFAEYDRRYADDTHSKIAFYCPNIAALNENILPAVREWYAKNRARQAHEIFSYYTAAGGAKNKSGCRNYPLPKNALAEFHNLDTSHSDKRVVLLVAVGKEGWDCRSLTAVALPRRETTPTFVLQAACRCLREVRDAAEENALVYLGDGNYEIFAEQLRKNHDMSVHEFENSDYSRTAPVLLRKPKLGELRYTQVDSQIVIESGAEKSDATGELAAFLRAGFTEFKDAHRHYESKTTGRITKSGALAEKVVSGAAPADAPGDFPLASHWDFLVELSLSLWGRIPAAELSAQHGGALEKIHAMLAQDEQWFRRHPHGMAEMCRIAIGALAACFGVERRYRRETITEKVKIELLKWDTEKPRIAWGGGRFLPEIKRHDLPRLHSHTNHLRDALKDSAADPQDISFNYVPYRFDSGFERIAILEMLKQDFFQQFELYYNGMTAAGLQSFQIRTPHGGYTPD
ncbi:MAG: DEAD/DEAH box helicase family protein, partial [Gammaproteobacteria bacterium]